MPPDLRRHIPDLKRKDMTMDFQLAAAWGSLIFGILTVVLLGTWFATGKKNAALRVMGGVAALVTVASFGYMTYAV
jgi:uncharacterized membrane protein